MSGVYVDLQLNVLNRYCYITWLHAWLGTELVTLLATTIWIVVNIIKNYISFVCNNSVHVNKVIETLPSWSRLTITVLYCEYSD